MIPLFFTYPNKKKTKMQLKVRSNSTLFHIELKKNWFYAKKEEEEVKFDNLRSLPINTHLNYHSIQALKFTHLQQKQPCNEKKTSGPPSS